MGSSGRNEAADGRRLVICEQLLPAGVGASCCAEGSDLDGFEHVNCPPERNGTPRVGQRRYHVYRLSRFRDAERGRPVAIHINERTPPALPVLITNS